MGLFGTRGTPKHTEPAPGGGEPEDSAEVFEYEDVSSMELDDRARELVASGEIKVRLVDTTNAASLRIDGPCARCGHVYSQTRGLELPVSAIRRAQKVKATLPRWADFLCACRETHPKAPPDVTGCGASYAVEAPPASGAPTASQT